MVAGEKDVETLRQAGRTATPLCGGAVAGWHAPHVQALAGKHVTLIPDTDGPNYSAGRSAWAALTGSAASLRWSVLPPPAKDVTEFLPQDGDLDARRARARTELPGEAEAWLLKRPAADQHPAAQPAVAQPAVALTLPRHTAVA